jgi:hypothetical protein
MIRHSSAGKGNSQLEDWSGDFRDQDNMPFLRAAFEHVRDDEVVIVLVGQRDLPGVALRRAQAILRWDLRPSLWSHALIVFGTGDPAGLRAREVTLHSRTGAFPDPAHNAVLDASLGDYDDRKVDANMAVLRVPLKDDDDVEQLRTRIYTDPNLDRLRYDLWQTLGVWQSYFWSAGAAPNPLREGFPVFSSSFVEYCLEALRFDPAPGASERNSAPEHLWNGAKWWHEEFTALERPVTGACVLRDLACTLLDPPDLAPQPVA